MIEIRLGPEGWTAQRMPPEAVAPRAWAEGRWWLCMSWPNGNLQAELLTDKQVHDWRVIYHDDSARTDPQPPQRTFNLAQLSQDLRPDKE